MRFLDWLLPWRPKPEKKKKKRNLVDFFRRKRNEPEAPEDQVTDDDQAARDYEESGTAIINNFYSLLEDRSKEATEIKAHESPGAGRFSGIAQDCHDLIEKWRASVGDGVTGDALERVEAEMRDDLDLITNYYNTDYIPVLDLQEKTFADFDNLMDDIIRNLTETIEDITSDDDTPDTPDTPEPPDKPDIPDIPDTPNIPDTPEKPKSWVTRFFNFITGRG